MVRMQLGSRPTSGTPRSTRGISRSRFRLAFFLASSTSPSESMGLPQHTTSGRCIRAPAAAKSLTAASPTSGRWYSFQVSLKRAISAGPAPWGSAGKRREKVFVVTQGSERELTANVSRRLLAEGKAVFFARLVENFGLHASDVNAGGAFGLASLAAYAEVHDLLHAAPREFFGREGAFDHGPEHVGPRPRGVLLVEGHHVGRAHRTSRPLAAEAAPVAQFYGLGEATLIPKGEARLYGETLAAGADAELAVHPGWGHDHTRVHHSIRVEQTLDVSEGPQDLGSVHLLHELRAREAVAVFPRDRPAAFDDEVGDLLGDTPHPRYAFGVGGVERRPDVQASHAGVAVEASPGTVLLDYLLEALDELLQPIRWHRRVLHKGDRFLFVARTEQERQGGLAEPDRLAHLLLCAQRRRNECSGFARQIVQFFEDFV